jgi:hypothetical protein
MCVIVGNPFIRGRVINLTDVPECEIAVFGGMAMPGSTSGTSQDKFDGLGSARGLGVRTLVRQFRIWGKKRGDRRTGSKLLGSVGEALFFAVLFVLGSCALIALVTSYLTRAEDLQPYSSGRGLWLLVAVLVSLVLIGAVGLIYDILQVGTSAERRSALAKKASSIDLLSDAFPSAKDFPTIPRDENLRNSPGVTLAYRLPIARSPAWKLVAAALFCLTWNGLVSVITVLTVNSHLRGESNWFLTLFALPFAAVGIWAVVVFLRQLLITTGIGPTSLEVSDHPLYPGQRYDVYVTQAGRLTVKSLRVLLVCDEEATYRQGTDVRTENRRVHQQQMFCREGFQIAPGIPFEHQFEMVMPDDLMHSFQSNHNAIHWKMIVSGEAAGWPAYVRDFPIIVYPDKNVRGKA